MTHTNSAPSRMQIIAAFAAIYIIWGSTYLGIRFAIETLPPFFMAGIRFLIAGGLMFAVLRLRGVKLPTRLQWRSGLIIGALLLLGGNGGVTWAEQYVPSGIAALVVALVPVWIVLVDWLRPNGTRPTGMVIVGLLLGIAGMVLLVGPTNLTAGSNVNLIGALALAGASLLWAIGSVYSRHAPLPDHPLMVTAIEMLCGGALLTLTSALTGEMATFDLAGVSTRSLLALLYLIVFGAIIAYSAYVWLLKVTTPALASTYAYVNPVVAVFLGWLFASEPITLQTIIAAAIIIMAVVVVITNRAKTTEQSAVIPPDALIEDANPAK
jgi:drug/metabolite transporter (DMT)-like permease